MDKEIDIYYKKYLKYKIKYLKQKNIYNDVKGYFENNQMMIVETNINNETRLYNRAGVLLIDNKQEKPILIMFMDKKYNTYIEPCGRVDMDKRYKVSYKIKSSHVTIIDDEYILNNILMDTAIRELREETLNTYNINKNILKNSPYVDTKIGDKYTRTYIIAINTSENNTDIYKNNRTLLNKNNASRYWLETIDIGYFFIDNVIDSINEFKKTDASLERINEIKCVDINAKDQTIWNVTAKIIINCFEKYKLEDLLEKTHETKIYGYNINTDNLKWNFLKGTYTFNVI